MANPFSRYISNVRFASKESNDFVLVFMSDGVVFCIETLGEYFLTNTEGSVDIARVARHQQLDLKDGFVLTLGENGQ